MRGFLLWNAIVLFLAVTVRQIVVLRENHDLTRGLEQTVADRTAELRGSEERLQTMIQHVSDVVSVVSRSGQFQFVSSSVRDVLGYKPEELRDVNVLSFVHPDEVALLEVFLTDMDGETRADRPPRGSDASPRAARGATPRPPAPTSPKTPCCTASCSRRAT